MKKIFLVFCWLNLVSTILAKDNIEFMKKFSKIAPQTVGLKKFPTINHYRYNEDCSGFIAFIFHLAGLNLLKLYGVGSSGVEAIWNGLKKFNFMVDNEQLQVGDILFFDNTYDKNKNGRWDDEFSHIAVVESVDQYQTITYLHYGSRGVSRLKMNLNHPEKYSDTINGERYIYNDLLRNSSKRGINPKYLSGALYRGALRINVKKFVE